MFTWEEAGHLRSMLQVLKWCVIALAVGLLLVEHEPIGAALTAAVHVVEGRLHLAPAAPAASPDGG